MKLELGEVFDLLRSQPGIGARATDSKAEGVRRFHLSRIHCFLYYRVIEDTVEVLALRHTSRGAGPQL